MTSTSGSGMNYHQPIVPIFSGENYDYWCVKMKTSFESVDLWDLVEKGFVEPVEIPLTESQEKEVKENRKRNANALSMLHRAVADSIFPRIMRAKTAKEAWEILQQEFLGDEKARTVKLQTLRMEFENMKMKGNETLNDFSARVTELVNQMKTYGEDITDKKIVEKILISLPEKFDPMVAVVEETKDIASMNVFELMGSFKKYEQRLLRRFEKSVENAFQSKLNI